VITYQELQVIAAVLRVSLEWLVGQEDNHDPIIWNAPADPKQAERILHLLAEYEERTGAAVIWAEFLLCSLVTLAFMHASHNARFAELDELGLREEKKRIIEMFDRMGNARRKRLLGTGAARFYTFTQIIFLSEMEKIAQGTEANTKISAKRFGGRV